MVVRHAIGLYTEHTVAGRSLWNLGNPGFYAKPCLKRANGKAFAGSFTPILGIINISLCSGLMGLWQAGFCPPSPQSTFWHPCLESVMVLKQQPGAVAMVWRIPLQLLYHYAPLLSGEFWPVSCLQAFHRWLLQVTLTLNDRFSLIYYYFWLR